MYSIHSLDCAYLFPCFTPSVPFFLSMYFGEGHYSIWHLFNALLSETEVLRCYWPVLLHLKEPQKSQKHKHPSIALLLFSYACVCYWKCWVCMCHFKLLYSTSRVTVDKFFKHCQHIVVLECIIYFHLTLVYSNFF